MATNTFITPSTVARMVLATLYNETVMLPLVFRDYDGDFTAAQGDTVSVRKPAVFTAAEFNPAVGVTRQNITETSVPVVMDTLLTVDVEIGSKEATLNLDSFQEQVVAPATEALAQAVDRKILTLRHDITQSVTASNYNASSNPHPTFALIDAARVLTTAKVPRAGRRVVIDEYLTAQWRRDELTHAADKVGDDGTALRQYGIAGGLHGFDAVVESNQIDDYLGISFHRTAFVFVTRPLVAPMGGVRSEVVNYNGLSIRVTYDYDQTYKKNLMSFDLLCGVKTIDATRACRINGQAASV